jgi:hypothetical protein
MAVSWASLTLPSASRECSREGLYFVGIQNLVNALGGHAGGELLGMCQHFVEGAHNLLARDARGGVRGDINCKKLDKKCSSRRLVNI